ncbi:MAG: efflux RND transporter periplasmic adaptor subunit [Proteobacteria bacterium]|nr:efflux RND transporter periplasmic adaptor subunit [Pseudomonadota bacterium]
MKKRILRLVILVLIITAAIYGFRRYENNILADNAGPLKIYGSIDIRDAALAFNEQERIVEILVEEGARIEVGQVLARLKTDRLEATIAEMKAMTDAQQQVVNRLRAGNRPQEIEQARAEVEAVQVKVDNIRQVMTRLQKTSGSGATSVQDLDDAKANLMVELAQLKVREKALNLVLEGPRKEDVAAAENQLQALQANLSLLDIRLKDMTLTAPSSGIIQSRILEVGEMAGPTRPVFTLALTDPKWVRAYVPEPQLGRINLGMKASVFSDSFPGQPIEGWVGFLSPVAEFTPRTVQTEDLRTKLVYEARIIVKDKQDRLRLGMPVTVIVNDSEKSGTHDTPATGANLQAPAPEDGV